MSNPRPVLQPIRKLNESPSNPCRNRLPSLRDSNPSLGRGSWINEERKIQGRFEWQKGYGVFSVSQSGRDALTQYIRNQREHYSNQTFEQEYLRALELHGVEYNPEYVFDEEITG